MIYNIVLAYSTNTIPLEDAGSAIIYFPSSIAISHVCKQAEYLPQ